MKAKEIFSFIKHKARKSASMPTSIVCGFAKDSDYIEITQWSNYEGYDIIIAKEKNPISISLTNGELNGIHYLRKAIEKYETD